jgi:hypothetical protein
VPSVLVLLRNFVDHGREVSPLVLIFQGSASMWKALLLVSAAAPCLLALSTDEITFLTQMQSQKLCVAIPSSLPLAIHTSLWLDFHKNPIIVNPCSVANCYNQHHKQRIP